MTAPPECGRQVAYRSRASARAAACGRSARGTHRFQEAGTRAVTRTARAHAGACGGASPSRATTTRIPLGAQSGQGVSPSARTSVIVGRGAGRPPAGGGDPRAQCPRLHRLTNATCAASHEGAEASRGSGRRAGNAARAHGAGPARMGFAWPGPLATGTPMTHLSAPAVPLYPHHFADRRWLRARHRRCPPTCQAAAAPGRAGGAAADAGCRPRSRPTTDGRAGVPPAPPASRRRWARRALRGRQALLSRQASQASRPGETPCPLSATIRSLSVNAYAEETECIPSRGRRAPETPRPLPFSHGKAAHN